jgi:hypothetical protein
MASAFRFQRFLFRHCSDRSALRKITEKHIKKPPNHSQTWMNRIIKAIQNNIHFDIKEILMRINRAITESR